ncbi:MULTISPECIES: hypothetical protein [unclassified Rhodococcus (in: high G+C Gram-positive bacteria)]
MAGVHIVGVHPEFESAGTDPQWGRRALATAEGEEGGFDAR